MNPNIDGNNAKDRLPPNSHGQCVVHTDDRRNFREDRSSYTDSGICFPDWAPFSCLQQFDETALSKVEVGIQRPTDALVKDIKVPVLRETREVPFLRHELQPRQWLMLAQKFAWRHRPRTKKTVDWFDP